MNLEAAAEAVAEEGSDGKLYSVRRLRTLNIYNGEFDPGSERTLAARFKHASRGVGCLRMPETGGRVSNT